MERLAEHFEGGRVPLLADVGAAQGHAVKLMLIRSADQRLFRRRNAHGSDQLILGARWISAKL